MARRLPTIARWINENLKGYTARIERGFCNTDRKVPGRRILIPGKGRYGNKLVVTDPDGDEVLHHNAAETYRYNGEVEYWLERLLKELGQHS